MLHVSSAVVITWPNICGEIAHRIAAMPDTQVVAADGAQIIVVMEGADAGSLSERLTAIALIDGVLAANLVFEHGEVLPRSEEAHGNSA